MPTDSSSKVDRSRGRTCRKCGADHWYAMKWKNGVDGWRCGPCSQVLRLKWKRRNPDKYREWSWREHGITMTVAEYESRLNEQGGGCAVCGRRHPKLRVDHCHKTGRVRGLLCARCNALAQDPDVLRDIIAYMERE